MNELIPIFPLEVVVYPGEQLNLHIFEPRYQQLINDCARHKMPFGIPSVVDRKIDGFGTTVELIKVMNVEADGQMDIQTRGLRIFHTTELLKLYPGKLYSAARVEYPPDQPAGDENIMRQILASVRKLHRLLKVKSKFSKPDEALHSHDVAHHVGLTLEQEYALLKILDERQRQEFLQRHLEQTLRVVESMESLKEKIMLNGHFKTPPGFEV